MSDRRFFVGGNWKMNGTKKSIEEIRKSLPQEATPGTDVVVGVPACYLQLVVDTFPKNIGVAAQNVYNKESGAFTGEISPMMVRDIGATWVITGHSERRNIFGETSQMVADKTKFVLDCGLCVIPCVGEKLEEREAGKTFDVVASQLAPIKDKNPDWNRVVIAYEPVWAIGTGKVATPEQAQEVHAQIREWLHKNVGDSVAKSTRIIYGGSVTGANSVELAKQKDIDGFLVGGASLKPEFNDIIKSRSVAKK